MKNDITVQEKRLSYRIAQQPVELFLVYGNYIQYIQGTQRQGILIYFSILGLLNSFANYFLPSIILDIFYFQKSHFPHSSLFFCRHTIFTMCFYVLSTKNRTIWYQKNLECFVSIVIFDSFINMEMQHNGRQKQILSRQQQNNFQLCLFSISTAFHALKSLLLCLTYGHSFQKPGWK